MEKLYCNCCNFYTTTNSYFLRHLRSKAHIELSNGVEPHIDLNDYKQFVYQCKNCDRHFVVRSTYWRHQKMCKCVVVDNNTIADAQEIKENSELMELMEIMKLQLELQIESNKQQQLLKDELEKKDKIIEAQIVITEKDTNTTKKSVNMLQYANKHILDGKPLKKLKKDEAYTLIGYDGPCKNIQYKEYEKHVKTCVHKYINKAFVEYVGDIIVEHYKPKNSLETNILTTDVSRISMLILYEVDTDVNIKKKEWINDKSGKRLKSMILMPLLNAFVETINIFDELTVKAGFVYDNKNNIEHQQQVYGLLTECSKLKRDIENEVFTQPILKYVAPSFHFDALKTDIKSTKKNIKKDVTKPKKEKLIKDIKSYKPNKLNK